MGKSAKPTPMQQRIAEQQRKQQAADRRIKIVVGVAIAVIVLVAGIVIAVVALNRDGNNSGAASGVGAQAASEFAGGKPIPLGTGGKEVSVYFDYSCPHCAEIEDMLGPSLMKAVDDGKVKLLLHPVNTVDLPYHHAGTAATLRAAAAQPDKVQGLYTALMDNYLKGTAGGDLSKFRDPKQALDDVIKVAKGAGISDETLAGMTVNEADAYLSASSKAWGESGIKGLKNGQLGTPMYVQDNTVVPFDVPENVKTEAELKNYFGTTYMDKLLK